MVTIDGLLVLDRVQPEGKKPMSGAAFLRGSPTFLGATLDAGA
jgi:methionyl-tRNA formyltransferase